MAFDQRSLLKLGQARANPAEIAASLIQEELKSNVRFRTDLLLKLKNAFEVASPQL